METKCDWCKKYREMRTVKSDYIPYNICWDCVAFFIKNGVMAEDDEGLVYIFTDDRLDVAIKNKREVSQ